jgi:hypothetical protein
MQPGNSATPVIIALIVAVAGIAILLNMDFGASTAVRNDDGLSKISLAAIANAGATVAPTVPSVQEGE